MAEQTRALVRPGQKFEGDDLQVIHQTVAKGTSAEQFKLFIKVCQSTGLNPFKRQIYAVVRGQQMTIQTSIDGYRLLAESTGKYAGQLGPWWCGNDGEWKEVWLSSTPPAAAKVGVLRKDFTQPVYAVAKYSSYYQDSSPLWKKMPDLMLAKCAEALVLRRVFPDSLSGVYTDAEMHQADQEPEQAATVEVVDAEVHEVAEEPKEPAQPKAATNGNAKPALNSQALFTKGWKLKLWKDASGFHQYASSLLGKLVNVETVKTLAQQDLEEIDSAIEAEAKAATSGK